MKKPVIPAKAGIQDVWAPAFAVMTAFLLFIGSAHAGVSKTGAILLQEPFGPRPFAMGQAYAGLGDDIFGMQYNPGSITRLQESQVATQFSQSIDNVQLGYVGLASPLNPNNALGLSVSYLNAGKFDQYDAGGNISNTLSAERDFLANLGYAHSWDLTGGRFHLGGAAKVLKSELFNQAQATAYAADLGGIYVVPWGNGQLSGGASVSNLGKGVSYSGGLASGSASDPLPLTTRLGFGYERVVFSADKITLGVETDRVFYDNTMFEAVGLEYDYHRVCAFRFGYRTGQDTGGLTMGIGLKFKNVSLDYGFGLMQTFNNIQQFSLNFRFTIPGIRYTNATAPSPLETLVDNAQKDIAARRFFDARNEVDKIQTFFPESDQPTMLKAQIDRLVDQLMITSPATSPNTLDVQIQPGGSAEYNYALGFRKYYAGSWLDAASALERTRRLEPDNKEIETYYRKARKNAEDQRKQAKLLNEARRGTLFEMANQSYENGDYVRAERILDEILRLGPYQPAESLKRKIAFEKERSRRPGLAPQPPSAPQKPPVAGAAAPTARDIARAEQLYYDAVRSYAEDNPDEALRSIREGLRLNPYNAALRNILEHIENEMKQKRQAAP